MIKVLFVCHGNICRSPLAEFLFKNLVFQKGKEIDFLIESAGTSSEEQGNPVHYGVAPFLDRLGIDYRKKRARKITLSDYDNFDYIVCMEKYNLKNALRFFGSDEKQKLSLLLDYTDTPGDVADPYYYGNFDKTFSDVEKGVKGFYEYIKKIDNNRWKSIFS